MPILFSLGQIVYLFAFRLDQIASFQTLVDIKLNVNVKVKLDIDLDIKVLDIDLTFPNVNINFFA
jgi:hypothetical protein